MNTARRNLTPPALLLGAAGEFVAQGVLEGLLRAGEATRHGALLVLKDGRRFLLEDALRVLGRRTSETDPYGLIGRVLTLRDMLRRGAIVAADGARVGAAIYDIQLGATLTPLGEALGVGPDESGPMPKLP